MEKAGATVARGLRDWSTRLLALGAVAVILAQAGLYFSVEVNTKAPLGYLLLLSAGVASFALGSAGSWLRGSHGGPGSHSIDIPGRPVFPTHFLRSRLSMACIASGVMASAALAALLLSGSKSGGVLIPWVVGLVAFAIFFSLPRTTWAAPLLERCQLQASRYYWDFLIVLLLVGIFLAVNIYDLENWYYSAIGDEFLFFEHAKRIIDEGIASPFSQEGVYNKHPVMNSVFQAASMRIFGADYFGWTISEVLNAALTIPAIYLLGHAIGGRAAAVTAAAVFAFSHYVFAFSHAGYTNLSPLPVSAWAIALFVLGCKRDSPLLLYTAGIIAGLGFYTHYSGRAVIPIVLLFALTLGHPKRLANLWPMALGFVVTVAPTFVVEGEHVLTRMFGQVIGGYSENVTGSLMHRLAENVEINLQAFHYSSTVHSYVYGPLLDPVSGSMAALGIAFALGHVRLGACRLLLIWFAVAIFLTGLLSPYPHVAVTRLTFVLPPLALLAGLLVGRLFVPWQARRHGTSRSNGGVVFSLGLFFLLAPVLALNLWQFWYVTPSVQPHTQEALAFGAFRSEACGTDMESTVFVGHATGEGSLMRQLLATFYPDGPVPRSADHDDLQTWEGLPGTPPRCVVFLNPDSIQARGLQESLQHQYPDGRIELLVNPSKTTSVEVFVRD